MHKVIRTIHAGPYWMKDMFLTGRQYKVDNCGDVNFLTTMLISVIIVVMLLCLQEQRLSIKYVPSLVASVCKLYSACQVS